MITEAYFPELKIKLFGEKNYQSPEESRDWLVSDLQAKISLSIPRQRDVMDINDLALGSENNQYRLPTGERYHISL